MPRIAWFTPLPPTRSGIAAYNAELLPLLTPRFAIDVFTTPMPPPTPRADAHPPVFSAFDFAWKHFRAPYDLVVYQLGNAACHDFMWPHLFRHPGLVVLHDGHLHHSRARTLLTSGRVADYQAEFLANHPEAHVDLTQLVITDLADTIYYFWPMVRLVARSARLVAVHAPCLAAELTREHGVEVSTIRHGMIDPVTEAAVRAATEVRRRHRIPEGSVLFAAFGLVTREKRIRSGLQALARLVADGTDAYLLLAGGTTGYYDAEGEARALGVHDRVRIAGYVADEDLAPYVLAADVCLCLRWPTSRELSGTWIRAIAVGKPTVTTALAHTGDVPCLDPRTWRPRPAAFSDPARGPRRGGSPSDASPVSVAIDLLDEDESLRLAMSRLAADASLRRDLGHAAREYWSAHHTMECAVEDYEAAIQRALSRPAPHPRLPAHLVTDGTEQVRQMTGALGVGVDFLRTDRRI
ncbi:MAG TPA: glycosyltransferase family 4 protein [Vicinamibacterales bacterium]|jgi:glycosyltransferase involved in cell wall biosynthesis